MKVLCRHQEAMLDPGSMGLLVVDVDGSPIELSPCVECLQADLERVTSERDAGRIVAETLSANLTTRQADLEAARQHVDAEVAAHVATMDQRNHARADLEAARRELAELRDHPPGIGDADIQRLFAERDSLREQVVDLENELRRATQPSDGMMQVLLERDELRRDLEAARRESIQRKHALVTVTEECEALRRELGEEKEYRFIAERDVDSFRRELAEVKADGDKDRRHFIDGLAERDRQLAQAQASCAAFRGALEETIGECPTVMQVEFCALLNAPNPGAALLEAVAKAREALERLTVLFEEEIADPSVWSRPDWLREALAALSPFVPGGGR